MRLDVDVDRQALLRGRHLGIGEKRTGRGNCRNPSGQPQHDATSRISLYGSANKIGHDRKHQDDPPVKLSRRYVEKPWGRTSLPPGFDPPPGQRVGEVWFTNGADLPLLAKYIFTSESLSIQVHPNDEQARSHGLASGKTECWYILDAEPESTLGLGLRHPVGGEELRRAAVDGSIEQLMNWRPVLAGDFFYVPAGTIHAIGAGISLLEFQQNTDVTYRLYDYGRPRELHLEEAVAVADCEPYSEQFASHIGSGEQRTLVEGDHFMLAQADEDRLSDRQRWVMPIRGEVRSGADTARAGECLLLNPGERFAADDATVLIGATN
jgi:mannose-6-phosphate isomerase